MPVPVLQGKCATVFKTYVVSITCNSTVDVKKLFKRHKKSFLGLKKRKWGKCMSGGGGS